MRYLEYSLALSFFCLAECLLSEKIWKI